MKAKSRRHAAVLAPSGLALLANLLLPLFVITSAMTLFPAMSKASELNPKLISITSTRKNTGNVVVAIGKSEDVRTDAPFMEVLVGDPNIADVNPLTDRAISILGKKIGTTRVSIYAEGKRLVGIFDVEVSYDIGGCKPRSRGNFLQAKIRVTSVNGRIMLSGLRRTA